MHNPTVKTKSKNNKESAFCKHLNVDESQLHKALAWYHSAMQNPHQAKTTHQVFLNPLRKLVNFLLGLDAFSDDQ